MFQTWKKHFGVHFYSLKFGLFLCYRFCSRLYWYDSRVFFRDQVCWCAAEVVSSWRWECKGYVWLYSICFLLSTNPMKQAKLTMKESTNSYCLCSENILHLCAIDLSCLFTTIKTHQSVTPLLLMTCSFMTINTYTRLFWLKLT